MRLRCASMLFVGAALLGACGSQGQHDGFAGAGDGGSQDASGGDGPVGSGIRDGGNGVGDAVNLVGDGATADGPVHGCAPVRIGIFGNPGSNPSSDFQAWLNKAGASATRVQTNPTDTLDASVLAAFDVVILDELVRDYTSAEASVLQAWVRAGGGLVSMTGYVNDTSIDFRANPLIAPLGVAYVTPLIDLNCTPVTTFMPHPITMGITSVTLCGGYPISDLGGTASTRTIIAEWSSNAVGYAIQMASGRAFIWGDEWIEYDSEWSTLPQIKQLWVNVFAWLAPMGTCGLQPQ